MRSRAGTPGSDCTAHLCSLAPSRRGYRLNAYGRAILLPIFFLLDRGASARLVGMEFDHFSLGCKPKGLVAVGADDASRKVFKRHRDHRSSDLRSAAYGKCHGPRKWLAQGLMRTGVLLTATNYPLPLHLRRDKLPLLLGDIRPELFIIHKLLRSFCLTFPLLFEIGCGL